jgi:hypothetical protein
VKTDDFKEWDVEFQQQKAWGTIINTVKICQNVGQMKHLS